jgi:hypothetical protein
MDWKGFGREQSWPNLKYYIGILSGGTEEKLQKMYYGNWSVPHQWYLHLIVVVGFESP